MDRGPAETLRQRYDRRLSQLREIRDGSGIQTHWRELSEFIAPRRGRFDKDDVNKGDKRRQAIINSTATFASSVLGSGMMAGMSSPSRPWFRLITPDPNLMENWAVKEWLYRVETRLRNVFARSNLYTSLPVMYRELGVFGTSSMLALEDPTTVVRFYPLTVGSYYLGINSQLEIDSLYRVFKMSVRQMVTQFGEGNVSRKVLQAWRNQEYEALYDVVHAVEPNDERMFGKMDAKNMPIRSCWYEVGGDPDKFLRHSGFEESPIIAPRWDVTGEDVYGSDCPGMTCLGDVKSLQHMERKKAQAIDKHVDPPMVAGPELRNQPSTLLPGGVTYATMMNGNPGWQPAYVIKPELSSLYENIGGVEFRIRRAFYEDLFLMLMNDTRSNITAREIEERHEEKLLMLGPVLERLNTEALNRIIDRTFGIMLRQSQASWNMGEDGLIPMPPEELQGVELRVEYISLLAQAQRMVGTSSLERHVQFVGAVGSMIPSALEKFDADRAIEEHAEIVGVSPKVVVPDDVVAQRRAAAQQQQQAMMAAQAIPQMAKAARDLGSTEANPDSLLANAAGSAAAL